MLSKEIMLEILVQNPNSSSPLPLSHPEILFQITMKHVKREEPPWMISILFRLSHCCPDDLSILLMEPIPLSRALSRHGSGGCPPSEESPTHSAHSVSPPPPEHSPSSSPTTVMYVDVPEEEEYDEHVHTPHDDVVQGHHGDINEGDEEHGHQQQYSFPHPPVVFATSNTTTTTTTARMTVPSVRRPHVNFLVPEQNEEDRNRELQLENNKSRRMSTPLNEPSGHQVCVCVCVCSLSC